jgi:hypothetical protein
MMDAIWGAATMLFYLVLALFGLYLLARVVSRAATKSYLETMDEHKKTQQQSTKEIDE